MKPIDFALLVLRLALGAVFVMHGLQKLVPSAIGGGGGIAGFTQSLTDLNVPAPQVMAWVVAICEAAGGALVAIGLFPRIAALGLLGIMIVAILKVHLRNGFFAPAGFEFPMVLGAITLAIVVAGAGAISLGAAFAKGPPKKPV